MKAYRMQSGPGHAPGKAAAVVTLQACAERILWAQQWEELGKSEEEQMC